jgi:antitoxin HicB
MSKRQKLLQRLRNNPKTVRFDEVEEYLALPYTVEVQHDQSGEREGWFARVIELPGCMTQMDTFDEVETMVQDAMRAWITTALDTGLPVPEPDAAETYTRQLTVRMSRSLASCPRGNGFIRC